MDLPHPAREHLPGLRAHRQHGAPAEQQRQQEARRRVEGFVPDRMPAPAEQPLHPPLEGGGKGMRFCFQRVILQPDRVQHDPPGQLIQHLLCHGNPLFQIISSFVMNSAIRATENPLPHHVNAARERILT